MGAVFAGLNEGVELVRVIGQFVGLEDDELAAADDDGGLPWMAESASSPSLPFASLTVQVFMPV